MFCFDRDNANLIITRQRLQSKEIEIKKPLGVPSGFEILIDPLAPGVQESGPSII